MSTPASNVNVPPPLPGVGSSANNFGATAGSLGNYNLFDPNTFSNLSYGIVNNPNAPQYQAGATTAGNLGTGGGLNMFQAGSGLYGLGNTIAQNTTSFNGQPLYDYMFNQNQQQANVENAMSGVGGTPYGAGVVNQADQQFNLNWQPWYQSYLNAGAQGAANTYNAAAGLQGQAPQQYLYGAGLPYGTFNNIAQGGLGALSGLQGYGQGAASIPTTQAQLYSGFATGGQNANVNTANTALNQANLGWQEANAPWMGVGQLAGMGLGGWAYGGFKNPFATPTPA